MQTKTTHHMKKYITLCLFISLAASTYGHQPDVSTTLLSQQENNQWILQVKAAMTAFQYEVKVNNPDHPYTSAEEFQDQVIQHLMDNISIVFDNNTEVQLVQPYVKLGHETNAIFEVVGVPENFKSIAFKNSSFKDINRNQSALVILKDGLSKNQFVLNNDNKHTVHLQIDGTALKSTTANISRATVKPSVFISLIGLFSVAIFLIQKLARRAVVAQQTS